MENNFMDMECKMVFLVCGYNFGMSLEDACKAAEAAREKEQLVIAFVVKPFRYVGEEVLERMEQGIKELRTKVDTLFVFSADQLVRKFNAGSTPDTTESLTLDATENAIDMEIRGYMKEILGFMQKNGQINLDVDDVAYVTNEKGIGYIGIGSAKGKDRYMEAVKLAVNNDTCMADFKKADNVIINFTGDVSFVETTEAATYVQELVKGEANIIFGCIEEESRKEEITVTILATTNDDSMYPGAAGAEEKSKTNHME